jgi:hypothetical protein
MTKRERLQAQFDAFVRDLAEEADAVLSPDGIGVGTTEDDTAIVLVCEFGEGLLPIGIPMRAAVTIARGILDVVGERDPDALAEAKPQRRLPEPIHSSDMPAYLRARAERGE